MDSVVIFDTTMRDGEQAPGATMSLEDKVQIGKQLERLNVDVIEAGFPANSRQEVEAVAAVARAVRKPIICGLARPVFGDIDAAWEAVQHAARPRIHVFISTSDIHLDRMLRKSREEVLEMSVKGVLRAKGYCQDVEFSPMDATRTDPLFIYQLLEAVIDAGATTVNIPDTVGYAIPEEFGGFVKSIMDRVPNIGRAVVSVHCHNDLGLAVANSLAAVKVGVRQIECCINGLGERAGNASLEEVVMSLHTRQDYLGVTHGIDTTQIARTSRLVSDITGMAVQANKAVVGANAFRHESGIHQDGVLKERTTYEIMNPKDIGLTGSVLHMGKTSGRAGFRAHLKEMGYDLKEEEFGKAWESFKEVVAKKKSISERDIEAIIAEEMRTVDETYRLDQLHVTCGEPGIPTASVKITTADGQEWTESAVGDGPVDAVYKAISKVVSLPNQLQEFSVKSITESTEAMGEVTIRIQSEGQTFVGRGVSTDIIVASGKAYLNALNRLVAAKGEQAPVKS
ncbi:MAG: 2-isopropylmalate synthase [Chloroflexi bacterium]|nr:2-isopropylmalate synthase [Chloroflexota bacterium]